MANERKVFEVDVQTGESGKRVKDVDQKLTELRAELTKAQAALRDFRKANKDDKSLVEQSATFQQLEGNVKKIRSEYGRLQNEQQGIKSNTSGLTNALREAAKEMAAGLSAELKKANGNLEAFIAKQKESGGTVDKTSEEYKALELEVQRLSHDYEVLQAQQKAVDATTDKFTNAVNNAANDLRNGLTAQLNAAQEALREFMEQNRNVGPIVKQTQEYQRLEKEVERLSTEYIRLDKAQSGMKSTSADITKAVGGVALKLTAGIAAFQGITSAIGGSLTAYGQSEAAQKRLEIALGGSSAALIKQAESLATKTKFDDDAIVSAQALLAQQKLSEDQIEALIPAILNLSEAQGVDLESATDAVAVSIVNGSDKLRKYGIDLDGAAGSSDRVADAVAKLNDKFHDQAEAAAQIGTGPLEVFKNNLGNLEEAVGGLITAAINPFLGSLTDMAVGLTELLTPAESVADAFDSQLDTFIQTQDELDGLVTQYDELKGKQSLTAAEQDTLNETIQRIGDIVPNAVTAFDDYGNAIDINKDKLTAFIDEQKAFLRVTNKDAIEETTETVEELRAKQKELTDFLNGEDNRHIRQSGVLYTKFYDSIKGNILVEVSSNVIAQRTAELRSVSAELLGNQVKLDKLTGDYITKAREQKENERAAKINAETAALDAATEAYKNQTATIAQLEVVKKSLVAERSTSTDQDRIAEINTEVDAIEKRIKALKGESAARAEKKKTDLQTFTENVAALEQNTTKELAVIKAQEEAKAITTEQGEERRLQVMRDAAQKRVELQTEFAAKGGFTIEELADITALQSNSDAAERVYQAFIENLAKKKATADDLIAFQFEQIDLSDKLRTDLEAFDAFSAARAKEEEALGLDAEKRKANQKERDAERLRIMQAGNAAVLQSQLDFIDAQIAVLQKVQASGQPFTEEQAKQLDGLLAQATELKFRILAATNAVATPEGPTSFLGKLFDITDEQAKAITDKAIGLAHQIGQAVIAVNQQNNAQQLADTTQRVNSEYTVSVDTLRSQQEAGLITQAEFEERRKALESKKNAALLAAKQKAFKANQKAALAEVALNTAVGITAAIRSGITIADRIAGVAFAVSEGILQAIVINQQKPPEFKHGGQLPGRVLYGPSHAGGGIPIHDQGGRLMAVAEGGEFIASREATERYLPIYEALQASVNQRAPIPRVAAFEQPTESQSAIAKHREAPAVRFFVTEADISNAQRSQARNEAKAEIGE